MLLVPSGRTKKKTVVKTRPRKHMGVLGSSGSSLFYPSGQMTFVPHSLCRPEVASLEKSIQRASTWSASPGKGRVETLRVKKDGP